VSREFSHLLTGFEAPGQALAARCGSRARSRTHSSSLARESSGCRSASSSRTRLRPDAAPAAALQGQVEQPPAHAYLGKEGPRSACRPEAGARVSPVNASFDCQSLESGGWRFRMQKRSKESSPNRQTRFIHMNSFSDAWVVMTIMMEM
jgi:hypothetical protein